MWLKGGGFAPVPKWLRSVLTLKLEAQIWQSVLCTSPGSVWACRLQLEELFQLQLVHSYWSSLVLWQTVHHKTTKSCPRSSYTFTYFQKIGWRIKDVSTSHYPREQEPWLGAVFKYGPLLLCKQTGCGSKPHFSTSQGPQLAGASEERGYSYTNGDINCPQDTTCTKQLFLPSARRTGSLGGLNIKRSGCDYSLI